MDVKIDLVHFGNQTLSLIWTIGKVIHGGNSITDLNNLDEFFEGNSNKEWVLFIDASKFVIPDQDQLRNLVENSALDVFHGGLRIQEMLDANYQRFVNPVWIYNIDVDPSIESSSLKLSVDCFLIRKSSGKNYLWENPFGKNDLIGLGFFWGFQLYRAGFIIRYSPLFTINHNFSYPKPDFVSELIFINATAGRKWLYWAMFRLCFTTGKIARVYGAYVLARKISRYPVKYLKRSITKNRLDDGLSDYKVSVFAPTLNRYTYLARELELLNSQTFLPLEVIVTDQTDAEKRSKNWIPKCLRFELVLQEQDEKGQCNAWNFCLQNAKGNYFLFLGDDADDYDEYFIENLVRTADLYKADVVGCNIREKEGDFPYNQPDVIQSDTFPICLVSKKIFQKSGGYDLAFNKGVRADGDLIIRMHQHGALVILNPSIRVFHHRAPVGGLRHHKERIVTRQSSRQRITQFNYISFTERYLWNRHFGKKLTKEVILIKNINMFNVPNKKFMIFIKIIYFVLTFPIHFLKIKKSKQMANILLKNFPDYPQYF